MYRNPKLPHASLYEIWMEKAACIGKEDIFLYPDGRVLTEKNRPKLDKALEICSNCPVLTECRKWAKTQSWSNAVVGGQIFGGRKK